MVGNAVLGEIVGTDLFASVPASNLSSPGFSGLVFQLLFFHLKELGAKVSNGLFFVLVLRSFVLTLNDDVRGQVCNSHCRVHGIDALAAVARGPEDVNADVFGIDLDFDSISLRKDGNADRRGVNAPARLSDGDALDAVDSALKLELAVHVFSLDLEIDLLETSELGGVTVYGSESPALGVGVPRVHSKKVSGKKAGLGATGARSDLDDRITAVLFGRGRKHFLQVVEEFALFLFESREFLLDERVKLGVVRFLPEERAGLVDGRGDFFVVGVYADDPGKLRVFLGEFLILAVVSHNRGIAETGFDFPFFFLEVLNSSGDVFHIENLTSRGFLCLAVHLPEPLDPSSRINILLLTRKKGVTIGADADLDFGNSGSSSYDVAAGTGYG